MWEIDIKKGKEKIENRRERIKKINSIIKLLRNTRQGFQGGGYETIRVDTFYVLRRMQRFSMLNLNFIYSF